MPARTATALLVALLLGTAATACAADPDPTGSSPSAEGGLGSTSSEGDGHGEVEGASEVAEPQLQVVAVDAAGEVGLLDLLTEETRSLGDLGAAPSAVATDGRYAFLTVPGGLAVVDSGSWTWDHGDHQHYYRAEPTLLGTAAGEGPATVATGALSTAGGTGVLFERTGEAVLLDNAALADGEVSERFRLELAPHRGLVAPLGDGAVVTVPDRDGRVRTVHEVDADGAAVEGGEHRCPAASGAITTVVGLVVGCADGALLWTVEDDRAAVRRIPYPDGADAPPATAFAARKHRPTVAALAGDRAFWLLDTREQTWELHRAAAALLQVSAVDDEEGHVVALDRAGRVRVYAAATGRELAVSRPLVAPDDPGRHAVDLIVDQERAYVNDPSRGVVHEVDYADGARVARTLRTPVAPAFVAETGR